MDALLQVVLNVDVGLFKTLLKPFSLICSYLSVLSESANFFLNVLLFPVLKPPKPPKPPKLSKPSEQLKLDSEQSKVSISLQSYSTSSHNNSSAQSYAVLTI